ncbi:MAG TPA: sugar phosphate isomerase/epimerase [Verrucomicrobiae bacterium]|nr:sugar phosphate isomerase/epimerase [Verrucomicrobiae bacterium]
MKLGMFTAILPDCSFQEVLDFAAENHFSCVEVACWPSGKAERKFAGVTHIDVANLSQTQALDLKGMCAERKVSISGLGFYPNPLDPDPAVSKAAVNHFKKVILAAEKLELKNANTFVGRDWTRTIEENWPRFLKVWKPIIAFAEDHGIKVGIENCPMSFTRDEWPGGKNLAVSPVVWRRMFNDISSPNFGLNYDPSHFVLQRMDPIRPLAEFKDKLFHLHAKDMVVDPQRLNEVGIFAFPKEWHTPRIPGFGEVDWGKFMAKLREIDYQGALCIEVEDETFGKSLKGRQAALKVARNVLAPYFDL